VISQSIVADIERAKHVLKQLESILEKLNVSLEYEENILYRRDLESDTISDYSSRVVILYSEALATHPTFIRMISKFKSVQSNYIQVDDSMESQLACRKIVKSIAARFSGAPNPPRCIINLQSAQMIPFREKEQVIIIGKRYIQFEKDVLRKFENQFRGVGFHFVSDQGLFGGGALTYELAQSFHEITIIEITLSQSFIEDESNVHRLLEILTE